MNHDVACLGSECGSTCTPKQKRLRPDIPQGPSVRASSNFPFGMIADSSGFFSDGRYNGCYFPPFRMSTLPARTRGKHHGRRPLAATPEPELWPSWHHDEIVIMLTLTPLSPFVHRRGRRLCPMWHRNGQLIVTILLTHIHYRRDDKRMRR